MNVKNVPVHFLLFFPKLILSLPNSEKDKYTYTLFPGSLFFRLLASDVKGSLISLSFVLSYTITLIVFQQPQSSCED